MMTPNELDARLAELGLSEDGFAKLIRVDVAQVKRWRSSAEAIPDWAPMALSLISEFRKGAREALERRGPAAKPDPAEIEPKTTDGTAPKLH